MRAFGKKYLGDELFAKPEIIVITMDLIEFLK